MSRAAAAGPRILVHVGSPKTGTTFLQQVLWSQRELAEAQGVRLPLTAFHDHFLATLDVRGVANRPPHPVAALGIWDRLVADSLTATQETVLISHELFAAASEPQARRAMAAFGGADVHVVLTARDLVRQLTAEWQEHVKHRATITLEEFVADVRERAGARSGWFWKVQDYAAVAARWGARLPPKNIHVVTLPPVGAPPELLWQRFAELLGIDASSFETESPRANTSLGLEQTEVLRRVNAALGDRLPSPGPYPAVAKDVLAHRVLAGRRGSPLTLDPETVTFAVKESEDIASRLADLGVDVRGSLDDLVPDPDEALGRASGAAYDEPPAPAMLEESIHAVADLLVELARHREQQAVQLARLDELRDRPVHTALDQLAQTRPSVRRARSAYRRLRRREGGAPEAGRP